MTYRRFGIPILALAASIFAGSVAIAPVAGASTGSGGVTRQIAAVGSTAFNPASDGSDSGLQELKLPAAAGNASSHNSHGVNRSRSIEVAESEEKLRMTGAAPLSELRKAVRS